jgi:hypothetical protein
LRPGMDI